MTFPPSNIPPYSSRSAAIQKISDFNQPHGKQLHVDLVVIDRSSSKSTSSYAYTSPLVAVYTKLQEEDLNKHYIPCDVVGPLKQGFPLTENKYLILDNGTEIFYEMLIECLPTSIRYEKLSSGQEHLLVNARTVREAKDAHRAFLIKASYSPTKERAPLMRKATRMGNPLSTSFLPQTHKPRGSTPTTHRYIL